MYFATPHHRSFAQERQAVVAREAQVVVGKPQVVVGEPHAAAGESQALKRVILGDMQCCHRSDTSFSRLETSLCMKLHIRYAIYTK